MSETAQFSSGQFSLPPDDFDAVIDYTWPETVEVAPGQIESGITLEHVVAFGDMHA